MIQWWFMGEVYFQILVQQRSQQEVSLKRTREHGPTSSVKLLQKAQTPDLVGQVNSRIIL